MKKRFDMSTWMKSVLVVLVCLCNLTFAGEKMDEVAEDGSPGLLIIAHGAPWPRWNQPVLQLGEDVVSMLGEGSPFSKIKVVFMEFAKPTVADGIKEFEQAGCNRIVAVPLLIAPSSHSHWDIPALLGVYSSSEMEEELKAEGAEIVRSKLPITITPTISSSDVIQKVMLKRVMEYSKSPKDEAVVLLAHGDHVIPNVWNDFMKQTITFICGNSKISYGDWACVEMGQSYTDAVSAIAKAGEKRKRVIVVGSYLSMGVDKLHQRWLKTNSGEVHGHSEAEDPFDGIEVVCASKGLLPDKLVAEWIVETAVSEIDRNGK
ncbi:MAG: sirohydrochlorin chelatase [Sedimentisphaeraceae bacterium JB056]